MAWISGSGLRAFFGRLATDPEVQSAGLKIFSGLGDMILSHLNDPAKLKTIGTNLKQNPEAPLVAMLKGTPAEKELDTATVQKGEAALKKAG